MCLGALGALDRSTTSADALARSTPDDAARVAVVVVVAHRRAISRVVRRNMARVASTRASPCGASGVFRFAFGDREDEARVEAAYAHLGLACAHADGGCIHLCADMVYDTYVLWVHAEATDWGEMDI